MHDLHSSYMPRLTRRDLFRTAGVGVAGYSLSPMLQPFNVKAAEQIEPRGGAEACIMIFLQGGASQVDTFDAKEGAWTPDDFDIRTVRPGVLMPTGTLPGLSQRTEKFAIVRSMGAWDLNHDRAIYYLQAGRPFSPPRLREIPSVGAVVAYEKWAARRETDYLPPFVSFNVMLDFMVGNGMLPSTAAPLNLHGSRRPPFAMPGDDREAFLRRRRLLSSLEEDWHKANHERAGIFSDLDEYRNSAYLLGDPQARSIFEMTLDDEKRYGKARNGMGHLGFACAMSRNIIARDAGTKFILIQHSSWDLHTNAYAKTDSGSQYSQNIELDIALSALLDDLETTKDKDGRRLIDKTLVVVIGEFGRTGGSLDDMKGRNHYLDAGAAVFAGAGVQPGRILGATNETGDKITDYGWHKERPVYPEDVLATIYSAMGIDWSKKITQTPSGRAFEYTEYLSPKGPMDFGEVSELFA